MELSTSSETPANGDSPRSRRVGRAGGAPQDIKLPAVSSDGGSSSLPSPLPSPPLPPRSPLRPTTRRYTDSLSLASSSSIPSTSADTESEMTLMHARSLGTLSGFLDVHTPFHRLSTGEKPLPLPPSPVSLSDSQSGVSSILRSQASTSSLLDTPAPLSKRTHALLELLSSERAYASDLALIRDIHIPLALGQPLPFQATPLTPPPSSNGSASSRAVSTASDNSSSSLPPPMTVEDTRTIFNNIGELAALADEFTLRIEEALGNILEGGVGEDRVGALFLEMIPKMEPMYTQYITKHPSALEHFNSLPQSPSLTAYLHHTRELAQSLTHAWDLPSLLIKPVQRLLKYSLLLNAIIEETSDSHPDKDHLREARRKMETVAHKVNEGRRRREVVKEVLTGSSPQKKPGETKAKKKGLNMGVSAAASLARMRTTTRSGHLKAKNAVDGHAEAAAVAEMNEQLKKYDAAIKEYAKGAVRWCESVTILMESLHSWARRFGRALGIEPHHGSDAFDAFLTVVEERLIPTCHQLSESIENDLLVQLSKLRETLVAPERLLEAMYTLEPLHYGLLNINMSKTRPSSQLLEASKSYTALRGQLYAELPRYLQLLEKGIHFTVLQLAEWQAEFWREVRENWEALWDALKMEGEFHGDAAETIRVWQLRFEATERALDELNIVHPPVLMKKEKEREQRQDFKGRSRSTSHAYDTASTAATSTVAVTSMMSSLEPQHPTSPKSFSSKQSRGTHHSMESVSGHHTLERHPSNESLRSKKSGKTSGRASSRHASSNNHPPLFYQQDDSGSSFFGSLIPSLSPTKPPYNRTKSMPISLPMQLRKSNSQGKLLDAFDRNNDGFPHSGSSSHIIYQEPLQEDERGRTIHKPNLRRRLTDSLRPSPSPSVRQRRSPSLPSTKSPVPSPAAHQTSFQANAPPLPALYTCHIVHQCNPPPGIQFHEIPFFPLQPGEVYDVLQEYGHPAKHKDLPLYVDDGEDCLLLVRNQKGEIGWGLASFMLPLP